MAYVQTVLGPIDPNLLGPTLMHEHLLCDITPPALRSAPGLDSPITMRNRFDVDYGRMRHTGKTKLLDRDLAVAEVQAMVRDGGRSIVELTVGGLLPDPEGLAHIARCTGIPIVMGCGHYVEDYQDPANHGRSLEDLAAEMTGQVRHGAWGTAVRAGIIGEIGCQVPWTTLERRVMHAAVLAQSDTGAALTIHPGADADQPDEIMAEIIAWGGDPTRTVMGHIDRTIFNADGVLRLAQTGCVLEFDLFGYESAFWPLAPINMPNDGTRLDLVRTLLDHGHHGQVVISQDICRLTRLLAYGGHGYGHIFRNVVPLMLERSFSAREVSAILEETPRRLLTMPQT